MSVLGCGRGEGGGGSFSVHGFGRGGTHVKIELKKKTVQDDSKMKWW